MHKPSGACFETGGGKVGGDVKRALPLIKKRTVLLKRKLVLQRTNKFVDIQKHFMGLKMTTADGCDRRGSF